MIGWFLSGIVMLFAGYPRLSESERIALSPVLPASVRAAQPAGLARLGADAGEPLVLRVRDGRLVYDYWREGRPRSVDAASLGAIEARPGGELAARVARRLGIAPSPYRASLVREADQWTLGGSYWPHFPLWRLRFGDPAATEAYVALATGELVQVTRRVQRTLAWLGAIPHWLYPTVLRRQATLWSGIVGWLALAACAVCSLGLVAELGRGRRGAGSGWLDVHRRVGLVFGLLAASWTLSGALSVNPLGVTAGPWPPGGLADAVRGPRSLDRYRLPIDAALALCRERGLSVRELALTQLAGRPYYRCVAAADRSYLVDAEGSVARGQRHFAAAELLSAVEGALGETRVRRATLRGEPDAYHYPKHSDRDPFRSPYLYVELEPDARTTLYLDAASGDLLWRFTPESRARRWLFHLLHSWDAGPLYRRRGPWRAVVILCMLAGAVLAASGAVSAGARWVRRRRSRQAKMPPPLC